MATKALDETGREHAGRDVGLACETDQLEQPMAWDQWNLTIKKRAASVGGSFVDGTRYIF